MLEETVQSLIGEKYTPNNADFAFVVDKVSEDLSHVHTINGFFELDVRTICEILSNEDLQVATELDVYKVGLKWITHVLTRRWQFTSRVMKCVRFHWMTQKEISECHVILASLEKDEGGKTLQHVKDKVTAEMSTQNSGDPLNGPRKCFPVNVSLKQIGETEPSCFTNLVDRIRKILGFKKTEKKERVIEDWKNTRHPQFGVPFEKLMCELPYGIDLPYVVTRVCEHVRSKGFNHAGILSGKYVNEPELWTLVEDFDEYGNADLEEVDVITAAELLKVFLDMLQESVVPPDLSDVFVTIHKECKNRTYKYIFELRQAVKKLPPDKYSLLRYLIRFLVQVSKESKENKMTTADLVKGFAHNFFSCVPEVDKILRNVLSDIMLYHTAIFGAENPSIFQLSPDPHFSLKKVKWFVGAMSKKEANRLLKDDGDFLVREKENRTSETQYILSIRSKGKKHLKIKYKQDGWKLNNESFLTIPDLVNYHLTSGLSVSEKSSVSLKRGISHKENKITLEEKAPVELYPQAAGSSTSPFPADLAFVRSSPIAVVPYTRGQLKYPYRYSRSY